MSYALVYNTNEYSSVNIHVYIGSSCKYVSFISLSYPFLSLVSYLVKNVPAYYGFSYHNSLYYLFIYLFFSFSFHMYVSVFIRLCTACGTWTCVYESVYRGGVCT